MKLSISCLYASYGRYIDGFRAIPSNIDSLKLSHRRALLSLYKTARTKYVKSAKVVGYMIGSLHPHGDMSAYDTIAKLVLQNYVDPSGAWGSRDIDGTDKPAAQRYTECRLAKWVNDIAFKYINYVPYVNIELENEPVFLPCPIPLGLIGNDEIYGIAFHHTLIPKYTLSDLAIRLKWLIENYNNYPTNIDETTEETHGPIIKPNFRDCQCKENIPNQFYNILFYGKGDIRAIPNGTISKNHIYIQGRVPNSSFSRLKKDIDGKILNVSIIDLSGNGDNPYSLNIQIKPKKKLKITELKQLFNDIWKKYLIKNVNVNCVFIGDDHIPNNYGIDQILINNYTKYIETVLKYRIKQFERANHKLFTNSIILIIKNILNKYDIKTLNDLISYFKQNNLNTTVQLEKFEENNFVIYNELITEEKVKEICDNNSITKLVNVKIDIQQITNDIKTSKNDIIEIYNDCFIEVSQLI